MLIDILFCKSINEFYVVQLLKYLEVNGANILYSTE